MVAVMVLVLTAMRFEWEIFNISAREFFWMLLIPLMVYTIFFAVGLWRNICPLATFNLFNWVFWWRKKMERQGPRINQLTGWRLPFYNFVKRKGLLISAIAFWVIVPSRLILSDLHPQFGFWALILMFAVAFVMGLIFPVKSGWCTALCPVSAAEKAYSINPSIQIKNNRCHYKLPKTGAISNCNNCSFNCMDVREPEHAYWLEQDTKVMHDSVNARMRKLFISVFPGFILSYYVIAPRLLYFDGYTVKTFAYLYLSFLPAMLIAVAVYEVLKLLKRLQIDMRRNLPRPEGQYDESYLQFKRRLDMLYITLAFGIYFYYTSNYIFTRMLTRMFSISNSESQIIFYIGLAVVYSLMLQGLKSGWNELDKGRYQPSWW